MAFANKIGSLLKNAVSSKPSIYQALRYMSSSRLFIGGLSYGTDDQSLREAFSGYGEVVEARVIIDRETGRSRGFGFITYTSGEEASAAITAMDGKDLHGRMVRVNYASDRRTGFGGGGGGGGYGGGGGAGGYVSGGGGYSGGAYGGSGGGSAGYGADSYGSGGGGYSDGSYGGSGGGSAGYGADSYGSGGGGYSGGAYGGSGGAAAGHGGDSYGSGAGEYTSGGAGGGCSWGSGSGSYVAGGAGGSDSYVDGAAGQNFASAAPRFGSSDQHNFKPDGTGSGYYNSNQYGSNYHNSNQYGSNPPGNISGLSYDNQDGMDESFKDDDDEPDDYANKKG